MSSNVVRDAIKLAAEIAQGVLENIGDAFSEAGFAMFVGAKYGEYDGQFKSVSGHPSSAGSFLLVLPDNGTDVLIYEIKDGFWELFVDENMPAAKSAKMLAVAMIELALLANIFIGNKSADDTSMVLDAYLDNMLGVIPSEAARKVKQEASAEELFASLMRGHRLN
jgi:hypothetical protein